MNKRALTLLFTTVFIDYLSFGVIFPLLPYYIEHFGGSALTVGLLAASFSIMQFIFSPIWGRLSDKIGRKPVILISLIGTSISLLGFGFARSIVWLFITRIIAGIFTSASLPSTYAYVADMSKGKERAQKFGILGAAWGIGNTLGPAFGGLLSRVSISTPFFAAGGLALLNFIFAYFFLPQSKPQKNEITSVKNTTGGIGRIIAHLKTDIGFLFILFFFASFTLSILEIIFPLFAGFRYHFNETNIGFFFTFIGIVVGLTQGVLVGKLVARFGEIKTIIIAHVCMIIGYIIISLAPSVITSLGSVMILAIGIALNEPSLMSLISQRSKEGEGITLGTMWSFDSLARVIGPSIGGFLYIRFVPPAPFWLNAVLLTGSLLILKIYISKNKN